MEYKYPTQKALKQISAWPHEDLYGLLEFVNQWWSYDNGRIWVLPVAGYVQFVTGGWSGNEQLIEALQDNTMIWLMYWQRSERGGRHCFSFPTSVWGVLKEGVQG